MELIEKHASFGGWQNVYRHYSQSLKCEMNVGVYLPPKAANEKLPVLYWLSGLTCNEQNFITKSGMQRYAAEHNIIVVAPDTSPRGSHVADADRYDLGQGAGFYLNATQAPWNEHYKMYDYIRNELPDLVMQPGTYVRPHRHPHTFELLLPLRGRFVVLNFDDRGTVTHRAILGETCTVLEMAAGTWHAVLSLDTGGIIFEVKHGGYQPVAADDYAHWAPAEGEPGTTELMAWYAQAQVGDSAFAV